MSKLKAFFLKNKKTAFDSDDEITSFFINQFGVKPKNLNLYIQAFTHKSKSPEFNNERLEYLGDTVLSSIVVSYLFKKYPKKDEGQLTILTSKLVSRKKLNEMGELLKLNEHIIAVEYDFGYKNILGNTFEAIIGAIYLDQGFEKTKDAIVMGYLEKVDLVKIDEEEKNYKSILIVWGQKTGNKVIFQGRKLSETNKYKSTLYINGKKINSTAKESKKEAEQQIAEQALSTLLLRD
ncbi:putative dsRNA-binding protein [bacterium]|nr:putative dsRNA-binding protein [bacterium]MDB4089013.1 putative dsRNA-binding protein [Flavobacteriales bacterium]